MIAALASPTAELVAVGDVMLGRTVQRRFERVGGDYPFGSVAPLLRRADLAFGNLECPLTTRPFEVTKRIRFRAPEAWAPRLRRAGFDALSVVNNHTLDCGPSGLADTRRALRSAGIRPLEGAAVDVRVKGLVVRFLSLPDYPPDAVLAEADLRRRVTQARPGADLLVLSLHWGIEGHTRPSARQRRLARIASQAGVDLLLGHGPHVLQPVEREGRALVAYSLGNFVFDSLTAPEQQSAVLRVVLGKGGVRGFRLIPCRIERGAPKLGAHPLHPSLL